MFLEHNGLFVEHNWHKLWASEHSIILRFWSIIFSPLLIMLTILNIVQKMQPHCAQQLEYTLPLLPEVYQNMDTSILWTHSSGPNSLHFRGVPLYTNNYQARACVIRPLFLLKGRGLLKILVWHQTNIFSTRPGNVNEMLGKLIVWLTFCLERFLLRDGGCGLQWLIITCKTRAVFANSQKFGYHVQLHTLPSGSRQP